MSDRPFDFSEFTRGGESGGSGTSQRGPSVDGDLAQFAEFGISHSGNDADTTAGSPSSLAVVGPPLRLLASAAGAAVVGALVALFATGRPALAVIAWLLAGPAAFGLLGFYVLNDSRLRARAIYAAPTWDRTAYWATVVLLLGAVALSAVRSADWVGRW